MLLIPTLPDLKPTSLQTMVIHIQAIDNGTLPSCNRAIHAQVLNWLQMADPTLSKLVHNSQESPLSLSGLLSTQHKSSVKAGNEFYFRIGLLDGNLVHPLINGLEKWGDKVFSLAKLPFVFQSINLLPGSDPWVCSSDYTLLSSPSIILNDITLQFLSPTSFKGNKGQSIQPFPLPESVFGNLQRRWNAFCPESLKLPKIQWSGVVSDYNLKTQKVRMENSVEIGAVGWTRYRFSNMEQARIATILSHFAFFAGVGRKTAMGMGQVILEEGH